MGSEKCTCKVLNTKMGCDDNNANCKISDSKCVDNFCRVNGELNGWCGKSVPCVGGSNLCVNKTS